MGTPRQQFDRTTFETPRVSEYFNARELTMLTGQSQRSFAAVLQKEIGDNALDAAESANVAPELAFEIQTAGELLTISVADNGPGIPPDLIEKVLDFSIRASDKAAYRSPTRGAQGNALKTVVGIPHALGGQAPIIIEAASIRHEIRAWLDPANELRIEHKRCDCSRTGGSRVSVSFILARLLNDLCARLTSRALATDEIRAILTLENAPKHRCTLRLPVPISDPKTLLKLLQLELSARSPGAPVQKLRVELNPVKPRIQQYGLFIPRSPEPAKLEVTLSRLSNLLGAENVGTPELLDTHRPDSFRMARFSAATYKMDISPCPIEVLTLRRYRPPQMAQVRLQDHAPAHIATPVFRSKVIACAGPWRSSGDWWKQDPWDHSEWDIAVTGGALYRVHEDLRRGLWYLEGNYD